MSRPRCRASANARTTSRRRRRSSQRADARADRGRHASENERGKLRRRRPGHDQQQQDVLQHVRAEEIAISERVDRRNQREKEDREREKEPADAPCRCEKRTDRRASPIRRQGRAPPDSKSRPRGEIVQCSSESRQNVNHGQNKNPDHIDEVPVKPDRIEPRPGPLLRVAAPAPSPAGRGARSGRRRRAGRESQSG